MIMFVSCWQAAPLQTPAVQVVTLLQYPAANSYHQRPRQRQQQRQQQLQQHLFHMNYYTQRLVTNTTRFLRDQVKGWRRGRFQRLVELLDMDWRLSALDPEIVNTQTPTCAASLPSPLCAVYQC